MVAQVEISVVIPCFNEAENVSEIAEAVKLQLEKITHDYEILFIDNCSQDSTVAIIKRLCHADRRIKLIVNNRNYGQLRSPTYGIYQASGKAIIGICADFQDPPPMIGDFIGLWKAGSKIVLGVKNTEDASFFVRALRHIGYAFFERFGDYRVIPGATGFGLYDREVVEYLKQWRDPEPFFRGMLVESGFPIKLLTYDRPSRVRGSSSNNLPSLISFAISGLGSSSKALLRLPLYLSFVFFVFFLLTLLAVAIELISGHKILYLLSLLLLELIVGMMFFFIGLIGEQVRLMSGMVRNAPLVIERERINFPQ
jgi:glycosyltransferase involved in cell wall biosynthesis